MFCLRGVHSQFSVLSFLPTRATKDGETFEDVEIFSSWLRLCSCAALRRRKSGVSIYGLLSTFFFSSCSFRRLLLRVCSCQRRIFKSRIRPRAGRENDLSVCPRARRGWFLSARRFALELEQARAQCASGAVGGGTALSGLSAEAGNADTACDRILICAVLHAPSQAWLGWGTLTCST